MFLLVLVFVLLMVLVFVQTELHVLAIGDSLCLSFDARVSSLLVPKCESVCVFFVLMLYNTQTRFVLIFVLCQAWTGTFKQPGSSRIRWATAHTYLLCL